MDKTTSMTFALGALLVAGGAAHADDLQIATTLRQVGSMQKEAPLSRLNDAAYAAHAQSGPNAKSGAYAPGDGYTPKICDYIGGPKASTWACR
jgi:hypothetical protein